MFALYPSIDRPITRNLLPLYTAPFHSLQPSPTKDTTTMKPKLTGVDNNQDPLPPLVDLCELAMLSVEHRGSEVEVVFQSFVSLDDDGSL